MKKIILTAVLVCSWPFAASAAVPVIDGPNLIQNALQRVLQFKSYVESTIQTAQALLNTTVSGDTLIGDLSDQYNVMFETIGEVRGIMRSIQEIEDQFDTMYPHFEELGGELTSEQLFTQIDRWLEQNRAVMKSAAKVSASSIDNLRESQRNRERALAMSDSAVGNLQVQQAANQMHANISQSLDSLIAIIGTYVQAATSRDSETAAERAAMKRAAKNVLKGNERTTYGVPTSTVF